MRQPTNNRNSVASSIIGSPLGQRLRCRYQNSMGAIADIATSFPLMVKGKAWLGIKDPLFAREGQESRI